MVILKFTHKTAVEKLRLQILAKKIKKNKIDKKL
jgi:hypothetical protein